MTILISDWKKQDISDFEICNNGTENLRVKAGLRPIDVLAMTYGQNAIIGSGGYNPEDVEDVLCIMKSRKWDIGSIITDIIKEMKI